MQWEFQGDFYIVQDNEKFEIATFDVIKIDYILYYYSPAGALTYDYPLITYENVKCQTRKKI